MVRMIFQGIVLSFVLLNLLFPCWVHWLNSRMSQSMLTSLVKYHFILFPEILLLLTQF